MRNRLLWIAGAIILSAGFLAPPAFCQAVLRWNAMQMGAVADGAADNTAVLQKALDTAGKAGGGIVELGAGRYRLNGTLSVPAGVTLQGTYRVSPTCAHKSEKPDGTVLLAYAGRGSDQGAPFLRLAGRNSAIAGLIVVYPEWKQSDVPPVPYPPCVESHDTDNVGIMECCFLNPYEAIQLVRAHRHLVRNVTGYPSKRGIFVDECFDIGHIENIHFWPFGVAYNPDDPYCKWVNTQGVAFELARTDWHYVLNTFCFGYGVGYKFSESKTGSTNGNFLGLGADSCRLRRAGGAGAAAGATHYQRRIRRTMEQHRLGVHRGRAENGRKSEPGQLLLLGTDRSLRLGAKPVRSVYGQRLPFRTLGQPWQRRPAIQLDAGKAIIQGCTFSLEGTHVRVGERIRSAILTANQAQGGFRRRITPGHGCKCLPTSKISWRHRPRPACTTASVSVRRAMEPISSSGMDGIGPVPAAQRGRCVGRGPFPSSICLSSPASPTRC